MNRVHQQKEFRVPSFARTEQLKATPTKRSLEIFAEISKIEEEIEKCRLKNC